LAVVLAYGNAAAALAAPVSLAHARVAKLLALRLLRPAARALPPLQIHDEIGGVAAKHKHDVMPLVLPPLCSPVESNNEKSKTSQQ